MARMPRVPRVAGSFAGAIVGIDVETACPERGAVCSIGVAIVARGEVLRSRHWLVDPGTRFDRRFIEIHGIRPEAVAGQPSLRATWPAVTAFVAASVAEVQPALLFRTGDERPEAVFVAHNAQFDRMQIEAAIGGPLPFRLACTVAMSRRTFPNLDRHNLATVAGHLRIQLRHHDALSDATASALIAHHCIVRGTGR